MSGRDRRDYDRRDRESDRGRDDRWRPSERDDRAADGHRDRRYDDRGRHRRQERSRSRERVRKRSRSGSRERAQRREEGQRSRADDSRRPSKPRARSRSAEGAKRRRSEAADGTPPATAGEDAGGALVALPAGEPVAMDAELTPEELQMMMAMGIPFGFDTSQGKHVEDESANAGAIKVKTTRTARQYMNRKGGFNRPLPAEKSGQKVAGD